MRRAARIDTFHAEVRDLFRAHGCEWEDTASVGKGFPDALACHVRLTQSGVVVEHYLNVNRIALIEVKSGTKARTKEATAEKQTAFTRRFPVWRIATADDAKRCIRWLKT